jgi:hypothetical protein
MFKLAKSKFVAIFLIISFAVFISPQVLKAEETGKGSLVAFVYGPDNTTPIPGAVLKVRNVQTGAAYESLASGERGQVELQGLDEGLYIVGITTAQGDFNIDNLVGIRTDEAARLSFALRPQEQEGTAVEQDERCPRGEWYVPEIAGKCDENYRWNPETERCECRKKRGPLAFFLTPLGAAAILAASAGVVAFGVFSDGEPSASAFK